MTDRNAATSQPDDTEDEGIVEESDDMLGSRGDRDDAASKDPSDWVTGDEPMTSAQRSYLDTLAREAGEEIPGDLTKAQASAEIERLQRLTGRGQ
jgi:Protein of unknown function (DUF3072)